MKRIQIILLIALLSGFISSCRVHRGVNYGSRKYHREHVPTPPPGYRGM